MKRQASTINLHFLFAWDKTYSGHLFYDNINLGSAYLPYIYEIGVIKQLSDDGEKFKSKHSHILNGH